jgi:X-Pro dipeptidyl-peptidase
VTLTAEGFDADGTSLGDVTDLATFTSSVATDVIAGNTVTFPTASPHTLTATVGTATGSVLIEVTPAAVPTPDPTAPPVDGGATPAPPVAGDPAAQPPVLIGGSGLPVTGAAGMIPLGTAAAVLLLAGAAFMMLRRRQRLAAASTAADGSSSSEEV